MGTIKRPFAPRPEPLAIPDTAWNDEPHRCLQVNALWGSHILGVLEALKDRRTWVGTEAEIDAALEAVDLIIENFITLDCATIGGGDMPNIGEIRMFATDTPPDGWLSCDHSSLARVDYPDLFAVIGTTFGAIDADHFYLPDFRTRFPVGIGTVGSYDYDIGTQGGNNTVQLTEATMPAHTHTGVVSPNNPLSNRALVSAGGAQTVRPAGTSDSTGGDEPHENRPPFLAVNFIIYAGA